MRAFIVGNGPSLQYTNLDRLVGEVSYGMQRIHLIYPKTIWRPNYWVCADRDPDTDGRWLQDALFHLQQGYPCYFRPHWIDDLPHDTNAVFMDMCAHWDAGVGDPRTPTEWHLPVVCRYGGSMAAALQLAALQGYNPLYVVGADLGLTEDPTTNHFDPEYGRRLPAEEVGRDNQMLRNMHTMAHRSASAMGVGIYNASTGGQLDEYPRVEFDKLF